MMGQGRMSIERKQFLVWLVLMIGVAAATLILWWTYPEFFRIELMSTYREPPLAPSLPPFVIKDVAG
jgi:hypothetical protein